jgi:serine/threonine-protein kinase
MTAIDQLRHRLGNRYGIERELGRGGMGAVYLARDVQLDRPVALKVLPPEFTGRAALRERFLRETRTAASFSHPNVVPVYAVEDADDLLAYAMAYIEGESLAERVKRLGPLSVRETVRMLQDVGYALAYAHGRGVVHRDIKPDNIMIERATGRALVMDFGIARVIDAPVLAGGEGLTRIGEVVGTPEYMSPEQATGDRVDGRSDLYSLGLTAYFALTGTPAVAGETTGKVLMRQITESLPPMRVVRPDLPPALAEAIDRCLAKDPAARFATAESLVEALDAAQLTAPEIPLPIRMFAQEAGTLSMVVVFGMLFIFLIVRSLAKTPGDDDLMLPAVMLLAVLFTRVMQTMREAGRLAAAGFTPDEVHRGLEGVVAEREAHRQELRADPSTRRARRRTLITALAQLGGAIVLARWALRFRHQVGPHQYQVELPGTVLIFSAMIMFGVSLALLLKSPFRMPISERLFRIVWLGPFGRAFVRFAGRGKGRRGAGEPVSIQAVGTSVASAKSNGASRLSTRVQLAPSGDRVANLESRIAELERWRQTADKSRV